MTRNPEPIIVRKNRKRAFWSLVIIAFFVPISAWLVFLGLQPGRPDISWSLVLFGSVGFVAFLASAIRVIGIVRAPWHLEVDPSRLALYTPAYDLSVPWDNIAGIAVDAVQRRPGCALVFEDVALAVKGATFHDQANQRDAVTDAATMKARMEDSFDSVGYHLGIPGRILEMGPDELAGLLAQARTGQLWHGKGEPS